MFQISNPFFFLLLGIIPILLIINSYTRVEAARWRKIGTLLLRLGAVFCLILALVGLQQKGQEDILAVVFLLDVSDSVPTVQQKAGIQQINAALDALKPTDLFSVILFAGGAAVSVLNQSTAAQPHLTEEILYSVELDRTTTNLAGAIQLGLSLSPDGQVGQKRLVLLSDGVQNAGEAAALLDLVRASEIEIFTLPLLSEREYEVWVRTLETPSQVRVDETFPVRAIVETTADTAVQVRLYRNDIPVTEPQTRVLERGKQPIDFPQRISEENVYKYRIELSVANATGDNPENNTGYGVTRVYGTPHILYIEGDTGQTEALTTVLEMNSLAVKILSPSEFPTDLVTLQNSDAIILSNVSADELSALQMEHIESYVRDLGKGLVVIGGDRAFGRGGYHDTPLEKVLPLEMTPRQKKESLALMLVVDASGSMANYIGPYQKIQLALEGVRASIRALDDEDRVGVIAFAAKIRMDRPPTTAHEDMLREVGKLRPGSGTKMYPALEKAHERLQTVDAKQKHILLLSDGKSEGDFIPLAKRIAADKMTLSTIAIGDADRALMKAIAEAGGGGYRDVRNISELPKIMADEVRQTQQYTVQEPFQPSVNDGDYPMLAGIDRVPKLYGYIATSEKELAQTYIHSHEDHPILAGWNYGLGRSIAFTSDVKPGWGADWIEWENFGKFWVQVVNWVLLSIDEAGDFDLRVTHQYGRGQLFIDMASTIATHGITFDARIALPNAGGEVAELHRVTPTRYSAEFPVRERGSYLLTVQKNRDGQVESTAYESLVLSYPPEFAEFETNRQLLNALASRTNGIFEPSPKQITQHRGTAIEHLKPLSFVLLIISLILFVLEMILRRFSIASGYLTELKAQLTSLRRREDPASSLTLSRLRQTKANLTEETSTTPSDFAPSSASQFGYQGGGESDSVSRTGTSAAPQPTATGNMGRLLQAKSRAHKSEPST
ncbi:VWA domain-containing protein [Candidatus Poribacteria bacterium]|nr:VWA domain-containing protein [Candidatus Poribacteria bacterium]